MKYDKLITRLNERAVLVGGGNLRNELNEAAAAITTLVAEVADIETGISQVVQDKTQEIQAQLAASVDREARMAARYEEQCEWKVEARSASARELVDKLAAGGAALPASGYFGI